MAFHNAFRRTVYMYGHNVWFLSYLEAVSWVITQTIIMHLYWRMLGIWIMCYNRGHLLPIDLHYCRPECSIIIILPPYWFVMINSKVWEPFLPGLLDVNYRPWSKGDNVLGSVRQFVCALLSAPLEAQSLVNMPICRSITGLSYE